MNKFFSKKRWEMYGALIVFILALGFYFFIDNTISYFLLIAIFALVIGIASFEYRVHKRLYGNNEAETREIIEYSKKK